jgi:hypothetical protein
MFTDTFITEYEELLKIEKDLMINIKQHKNLGGSFQAEQDLIKKIDNFHNKINTLNAVYHSNFSSFTHM